MTSQTLNPAGYVLNARSAIVVALLAIGTLALVFFIPDGLFSADTLTFVVVASGFAVAIFGALAIAQAKSLGVDGAFFLMTLVIWVFVMISEGVFVHLNTTEGAVAGQFGAGVYQEAASWVLAMVALLFITFRRPQYLLKLFSGQFKWISLFALLAFVSTPISVSPLYSLAWTFKLVLVVLLLRALASSLRSLDDVIRMFQVLLVGVLGITVIRFVTPFLQPGPAFRTGRLEEIANLSGSAGLLIMLVLINLKFKKSPWLLLIIAFGVVAMMLAGGKAGIAGSVISIMAFFVFTKRARYAVATFLVLSVVFGVFMVATPIGEYLERYGRMGQTSTLTGRTALWALIWPQIVAHPIIGHGYLASRFLSVEVKGVFTDAGQAHNSLLEPLYNNGIPGLLLILIISFIIVRNLLLVRKYSQDPTVQYIAAGALAMAVNIFIWGMLSATAFGGSPDCPFMTFLAIFVASAFLRRMTADSVATQRLVSATA